MEATNNRTRVCKKVAERNLEYLLPPLVIEVCPPGEHHTRHLTSRSLETPGCDEYNDHQIPQGGVTSSCPDPLAC